MRRAIREYVCIGLALGIVVGVSLMGLGCSTIPARPAELEQARTTFAQAQQDPQVATNAPVALREAEEAMRRAEQAWEKDKNLREVRNLAAVAQRRVEVARAAADKKMAEDEIEQLRSERERVLLEARTREAERMQREADVGFQQVRLVTSRERQLEQDLAALRAQVRETERGLVLTLGDAVFGTNQATLLPGARQRLQPLVTFLRERPEQFVSIEGYTDGTGPESVNLGLAQRRAEAVRSFLIQNGLEATRISARGYGQASPDRRVEVVMTR